MLRGIELVAERETKALLDPAKQVAARLKKAAFANGLICYPMNGTIDGQFGDHILIAPPFIITGDQIDKFAHAARYAGTA
jgi:adenosylmethionine-8-amino-7-oxononanoate aminotransferase